MEELKFNINENFHRTICQSLGQLLAGVTTGKITRDTKNSWYAGHEFGDQKNAIKGKGYFLKIDAINPGGNKGPGRSAYRIIVKVNKDGTLADGEAWVWNHADGLRKLGPSFFTAGPTLSFKKFFGA